MDSSPTRVPATVSRHALRLLILPATLVALAVPPAAADPGPQWISQDASGVLHWEDGSEVRLWGVSYIAPFSGSFTNIRRLRLDMHEVIDRDLDDIAALEANHVRVLVFDREITDPEGNLRDNPHLEALDYVVAGCRERGLYVTLTAIAWLEAHGDSTDGFSDHWYRDELIRLPAAYPAQENYLTQLAGHVNPHTGLAYAADPTIAVWDLIHEPQATGMTKNLIPLDRSAIYASRMKEALRKAGVRNPITYSSYGFQYDKPEYGVVFKNSGVSGWTFDLPVGGEPRHVHDMNVLSRRSWQTWLLRTPVDWVWGDGFFVNFSYRFHGFLTSYWYPALARSLAASRVQVASLFQYDSRPLASHNVTYRFVWFNRDYTPAAATSFRMGARLFRETPLGTPVADELPQDNWDFDGVRTSHWLDVATMTRDGEFLFTRTPPHEIPGTLEDYRLFAGADSTGLLGFEGVRWFTSAFDAEDGRLDLELGPRVRVLQENPFETGKWSLNIRFCKQVAELDESPAWVELGLADDRVAVYRESDGAWTAVPVDGLRFDAAPGKYRIYLDESR